MFLNLLMSIATMATITFDMQNGAWRSTNDGVMGGQSIGSMSQSGDSLKFAGRLSLENNGGFSSVRMLVEQDLANTTYVQLEVRGDGRDYQFRLHQRNSIDGVAWRAAFSTSDKWTSIEIALDEFTPVYRGRTIARSGPVVPSEIQQIGFLLADKNPGQFELEIRKISFLGTRATATQ